MNERWRLLGLGFGCVLVLGVVADEVIQLNHEASTRLATWEVASPIGMLAMCVAWGAVRGSRPAAVGLAGIVGLELGSLVPLPMGFGVVGVQVPGWLTGLFLVAAAACLLSSWKWPRLATATLAGLFVVVGVVAIRMDPHDVIDVITSVKGAASDVLHGRNPYTDSFPVSIGGRTAYGYLPASFLVLLPFHLLGDVRFGGAVAIAVTAGLTAWARPFRGPVWALVVLLLPCSVYTVEKAWNEPLILLWLVASAVLAERGRLGWSAVCLGLALATKQHVVLLIPLMAVGPLGWRGLRTALITASAICLPWFVAAPRAFVRATVLFFVDLPHRPDTVSLDRFPLGPLAVPIQLGAIVVALAVCLRWFPRTPGGFLLSSAFVLGALDLTNKQTFLNQWQLVAWLWLAGLALSTEPISGGKDGLAGHPRAREASRDGG